MSIKLPSIIVFEKLGNDTLVTIDNMGVLYPNSFVEILLMDENPCIRNIDTREIVCFFELNNDDGERIIDAQFIGMDEIF